MLRAIPGFHDPYRFLIILPGLVILAQSGLDLAKIEQVIRRFGMKFSSQLTVQHKRAPNQWLGGFMAAESAVADAQNEQIIRQIVGVLFPRTLELHERLQYWDNLLEGSALRRHPTQRRL